MYLFRQDRVDQSWMQVKFPEHAVELEYASVYKQNFKSKYHLAGICTDQFPMKAMKEAKYTQHKRLFIKKVLLEHQQRSV